MGGKEGKKKKKKGKERPDESINGNLQAEM